MAWSILPSCFELSLWIDCPPITNSVANSNRNSFLEQWVLEFRFGLFRSSLLLFSQSYRVRCQCFHDGVVDFQFRGAMPNNCLVWLGVFYHRVLSCHCGLIVRRLQIRWPICVVVHPSGLLHDMDFANRLCGGGILISFLLVGCGKRSLGGSTVCKVILPRLGC